MSSVAASVTAINSVTASVAGSVAGSVAAVLLNFWDKKRSAADFVGLLPPLQHPATTLESTPRSYVRQPTVDLRKFRNKDRLFFLFDQSR